MMINTVLTDIWILACLGTIHTNTVELEVWSGHKWICLLYTSDAADE